MMIFILYSYNNIIVFFSFLIETVDNASNDPSPFIILHRYRIILEINFLPREYGTREIMGLARLWDSTLHVEGK